MGRKKKYCKSCDWELCEWEKEYPTFHKDIEFDVKRAKDYCEEHEMLYSNTRCKPLWRKCCGILDHYVITIIDTKKIGR